MLTNFMPNDPTMFMIMLVIFMAISAFLTKWMLTTFGKSVTNLSDDIKNLDSRIVGQNEALQKVLVELETIYGKFNLIDNRIKTIEKDMNKTQNEMNTHAKSIESLRESIIKLENLKKGN